VPIVIDGALPRGLEAVGADLGDWPRSQMKVVIPDFAKRMSAMTTFVLGQSLIADAGRCFTGGTAVAGWGASAATVLSGAVE
jgi:hypothetical protein